MAHLWGRPPVLHRHCLPSTPQHACHMRPTPPNATPTMSRPLLPQVTIVCCLDKTLVHLQRFELTARDFYVHVLLLLNGIFAGAVKL